MDIASACLVGEMCRYNGGSCEDARIKQMYMEGKVTALCPECLGGLPTPRCPAEIVGGDGGDVLRSSARVQTQDGIDCTQAYIDGAKETLEVAIRCGARRAYLKSGSPSCGCDRIYDGSFSGIMRDGRGVAAALLAENGIDVIEV